MSSRTEGLQPIAERAKMRIHEARKTLIALRGKAEKSLKKLAVRSRARGRELSALANRIRPSTRINLEGWQDRLLESTGVATRGQVREINRELTRISKKLDALSTTK